MMVLVSACLAGINCTWDGRNKLDTRIKNLLDKNLAIAICPELLGGRSIPRTRAEIKGGSGEDVLNGKAKVLDENGKDVTVEFLKGAYATVSIAQKYNIKKAILKSKSPSCAIGKIYDGSFKDNLISGNGVTASLLKKEGVEVSCQDT